MKFLKKTPERELRDYGVIINCFLPNLSQIQYLLLQEKTKRNVNKTILLKKTNDITSKLTKNLTPERKAGIYIE